MQLGTHDETRAEYKILYKYSVKLDKNTRLDFVENTSIKEFQTQNLRAINNGTNNKEMKPDYQNIPTFDSLEMNEYTLTNDYDDFLDFYLILRNFCLSKLKEKTVNRGSFFEAIFILKEYDERKLIKPLLEITFITQDKSKNISVALDNRRAERVLMRIDELMRIVRPPFERKEV